MLRWWCSNPPAVRLDVEPRAEYSRPALDPAAWVLEIDMPTTPTGAALDSLGQLPVLLFQRVQRGFTPVSGVYVQDDQIALYSCSDAEVGIRDFRPPLANDSLVGRGILEPM
jgi:hypothetical protein